MKLYKLGDKSTWMCKNVKFPTSHILIYALKYINWSVTQLKSTCGPCAMFSRFTIKCVKHMLETGLITSLFAILGQSQASIILKSVGI